MTIQQPPDAEQRFGAAMTEIARRDLDVSIYDLGDGRYRCHLQRWGAPVEFSAYSQLQALEGALHRLIEGEQKETST